MFIRKTKKKEAAKIAAPVQEAATSTVEVETEVEVEVETEVEPEEKEELSPLEALEAKAAKTVLKPNRSNNKVKSAANRKPPVSKESDESEAPFLDGVKYEGMLLQIGTMIHALVLDENGKCARARINLGEQPNTPEFQFKSGDRVQGYVRMVGNEVRLVRPEKFTIVKAEKDVKTIGAQIMEQLAVAKIVPHHEIVATLLEAGGLHENLDVCEVIDKAYPDAEVYFTSELGFVLSPITTK